MGSIRSHCGKRSRTLPICSGPTAREKKAADRQVRQQLADSSQADLVRLIEELSEQMRGAAAELQFELAARLRDEIADLKKELRQMRQAQ